MSQKEVEKDDKSQPNYQVLDDHCCQVFPHKLTYFSFFKGLVPKCYEGYKDFKRIAEQWTRLRVLPELSTICSSNEAHE